MVLTFSNIPFPPGGSDAVAAGEGALRYSNPRRILIALALPARFLATLPKGGWSNPPRAHPVHNRRWTDMDYRFENWVPRRAPCKPHFLRSFMRESRVMKPLSRITG